MPAVSKKRERKRREEGIRQLRFQTLRPRSKAEPKDEHIDVCNLCDSLCGVGVTICESETCKYKLCNYKEI